MAKPRKRRKRQDNKKRGDKQTVTQTFVLITAILQLIYIGLSIIHELM